MDLTVLRNLRSQGEMRNFIDWGAQPGVREVGAWVELVGLH